MEGTANFSEYHKFLALKCTFGLNLYILCLKSCKTIHERGYYSQIGTLGEAIRKRIAKFKAAYPDLWPKIR